jgi:hypothetical protein
VLDSVRKVADNGAVAALSVIVDTADYGRLRLRQGRVWCGKGELTSTRLVRDDLGVKFRLRGNGGGHLGVSRRLRVSSL